MKDRIMAPAAIITLILLLVFSLICITRQTDQVKLLNRRMKELSEGKRPKIDKRIISIETGIKEVKDRLAAVEKYIKEDKIDRCADVKVAIEEIRQDIKKMKVDIRRNKSFHKKRR